MDFRCLRTAALAAPLLLPALSRAQETGAAALDAVAAQAASAQTAGDNAWVLVSTALVLMMTAPGLVLFYGGLVRAKNVLSVITQGIFLMGAVSVVWLLFGYSLAFSKGNAFIGGLDYVLLRGVGAEPGPYAATIPHQTFMLFQLMFAIITPALICGAFAERFRFKALVPFTLLWLVGIYVPLAHMVWGDGGLFNAFLGPEFKVPALDFAGGTVVHISSGVSALVCALYLGRRSGYPGPQFAPHSLVLTALGGALLWMGWFGFNAGSALAANGLATSAFAATHFSAAGATVAWMAMEWMLRGRPSLLGAVSGAVAGLVAVTPASGFVTPVSGLLIGLSAGVACFFACTKLKTAFGYDDSLDVFGVHGVGGTLGAVLTGVFATKAVNPAFGPDAPVGLIDGNGAQIVNQLIAAGTTIAFAAAGTFALLFLVDRVISVRATEDEQDLGLDIVDHGESGYHADTFGGALIAVASRDREPEAPAAAPVAT
jgi:Amt family ammonium transporter